MQQIMERDIDGTQNRNLTLEWAMENDLVCTNTFFKKDIKKLITHKFKTAPPEYENWEDADIFGQIEFFLDKPKMEKCHYRCRIGY